VAELVKPDQKMSTLRKFFDENKGKVSAILPKHLSLNRQGQLLFTAVYRDPNLLDCTPASLVGALIQGGMLGLEPIGAGGYYLVPFWENKRDRRNVTMIIDYRAVLSLARNSKEIASFDIQPVYEKDHFDYAHGTNPRLEHKPQLGGNRGKPIAYYMVASLKGGGFQFEVMSVEEVQRHKDRFSKTWKNLPMSPDLDWYGLKTVIKQGCKMLPMSVQALTAIVVDDQADLGIDQNLGSLLDGVGVDGDGEAPKGKIETLTEELKNKKTNGNPAATTATAPNPAAPPAPANPEGEVQSSEQQEPTTSVPDAAPTSTRESTTAEPQSDSPMKGDDKGAETQPNKPGASRAASTPPSSTEAPGLSPEQVALIRDCKALLDALHLNPGQRNGLIVMKLGAGVGEQMAAPKEKLSAFKEALEGLVQRKAKK
jgi:recombination protein RecT